MLKPNTEADHPNVMVSSTYTDLIKHRQAVVDALLRLGCFPIGMEFDSAKAGKDVIDSSLGMVAKAHAYIGIISHRYGGVPQDAARNPDQLSITALEYRAALQRGIPVYMFLMSNAHPVTVQDVEAVEANQIKLKALKADAQSRSITAQFSSVDELVARVLQSMAEFKEELAQSAETEQSQSPGKPELNMPAPPDLLAIPNFISGHPFVGRRAELFWLDTWALGPEPLMIFEAIGGTGKSTLVWQWLSELIRAARSGFAGMLWYSFYEGGADMAAFAAYALAYITGRPLKEFRGRKTADLARELVPALRTRPFLLVLDGLERVLVAYHRLDAPQTRDDHVAAERNDRACIKPSDADLLRQLVMVQPSKILITSRLMPTALTNSSGRPLPGVHYRKLGGLHPDDALTMMRGAGVQGEAIAIQRYLRKNFDNHPLMLGIVAGLVNDYFREPGNFDRWADDPQGGAALDLSQLDLSQRRTHILAAALNGLEPGARQLLSRIAALGGAVPFDTVAALNPFLPPAPDTSDETVQFESFRLERLRSLLEHAANEAERDWIAQQIGEVRARIAQAEAGRVAHLRAVEAYRVDEACNPVPKLITALKDLEQRGLLQWDRKGNSYDLHPVVRGYAFDVLEQTERIAISNRIVDHFQSQPPDVYAKARTLADVQQSINIFRALVQARRLDEAAAFYTGEFAQALIFSLELYHEVLALLKPLFPEGFHRPPSALIGRHALANLLNDAAIALHELQRFSDAQVAYEASLYLSVAENNPYNINTSLDNLSSFFFDQGHIAASFAAIQLALELAQALEEAEYVAVIQLHIMDHYYSAGQLEQAEAAYAAFRQLPTPTNYATYRPGGAELRSCWLRFYQGRLNDDDLDQAQAAMQRRNRPGLRSLTRLRGELALQRGNVSAAISMFERAIEMHQVVGLPVADLEARLALTKAISGDREQAREICDRLHELSEPPHVWLAVAYLEVGAAERAREHILVGYEWAWAEGPPYAYWWELEQCRAVLTRLGEPEPQLPPVDPAAAEPLPYEAEIRRLIAELKQKKGVAA